MSEPTEPASAPTKRRWQARRPKNSTLIVEMLALVAAVLVIGTACGSSSTKDGAAAATTSSDTSVAAAPIVHGAWKAGCNQYSAGDLGACKAVHVTKVTCQWQGDDVHLSAVFKNTFSAHVTVHMNPTYTLKNAGLHGNGLTSTKDIGLDAGELRTFTVNQNPEGVDSHPRISSCHPGVDVLQGVELG